MTERPETCTAPHRHDPERPRRASHGRLCTGHYLGLVEDLAELPRLHDALVAQLVARGGDDAGRRSDSDAIGISLDNRVVRARDHIRATLVAWTRIALEEGPWTHAPDDRLTDIAAWLGQRRDWLAAQPWADELVLNLRETRDEARRLRQPNTAYRVEIGPCPEPLLAYDADTGEVTHAPCPGTVIALMHRAASREQLPARILCTEHGEDEEAPHAWGPMQWHALGRRMGRSLDASAADAFLRAVGGSG